MFELECVGGCGWEEIHRRGFRNRRSDTNTHIGEGMTRYTLDGERVGYGLSEYLDQPEED